MTRWTTLLALCTTLSVAGHAYASTPLERLTALLESQGYTVTEIEKTWLGRLRIEASNGSKEREIVIDRATGEILRDTLSHEEGAAGND